MCLGGVVNGSSYTTPPRFSFVGDKPCPVQYYFMGPNATSNPRRTQVPPLRQFFIRKPEIHEKPNRWWEKEMYGLKLLLSPVRVTHSSRKGAATPRCRDTKIAKGYLVNTTLLVLFLAVLCVLGACLCVSTRRQGSARDLPFSRFLCDLGLEKPYFLTTSAWSIVRSPS